MALYRGRWLVVSLLVQLLAPLAVEVLWTTWRRQLPMYVHVDRSAGIGDATAFPSC
jgi:hypothetical protein